MTDIIVVLVLLTILGGAAFYVYRAKKKGARCIGCPHSGSCGKADCGSCSCGSETK